MKSHELAKILLGMPNKEIKASVDISTCDEDSGRRAFGDFVEINDFHNENEVMMLFEGSLNE